MWKANLALGICLAGLLCGLNVMFRRYDNTPLMMQAMTQMAQKNIPTCSECYAAR